MTRKVKGSCGLVLHNPAVESTSKPQGPGFGGVRRVGWTPWGILLQRQEMEMLTVHHVVKDTKGDCLGPVKTPT